VPAGLLHECAAHPLTVSARRFKASCAGPGRVFLICSLKPISCWSSFLICSSILSPLASRFAPACSSVGGGSFFLGAPNMRRIAFCWTRRGSRRSWEALACGRRHSQQQNSSSSGTVNLRRAVQTTTIRIMIFRVARCLGLGGWVGPGWVQYRVSPRLLTGQEIRLLFAQRLMYGSIPCRQTFLFHCWPGKQNRDQGSKQPQQLAPVRAEP